MKTPKNIDILITDRCNLSCDYCSNNTDNPAGDLPVSEWIAFLEEAGRACVLNIGIGGGEPFIRNDLREIILAVVRNRMRFTIVSNGALITDSIASFISSTGRCDSIQISLDGSHSEPHDVFRGEGSFQDAVRGIEILKQNGIFVGVRVTIHRRNVNDLEAMAKFLIEELKLPGFSTNSASHLGMCRKNSEEIQLTVGDRMRAMRSLLELSEKYKGRIDASAGPLAEARFWQQMENSRKAGEPESENTGYLQSCGGVFTKMAVKANGMMIPCSQMGHLDLGRINQDDLVDTWQNHRELERLRLRTKIPLSDFRFCQDCEYTKYCRGNCPALAYTITGHENHPSPDACLKRFLEAGGEIPASTLRKSG